MQIYSKRKSLNDMKLNILLLQIITVVIILLFALGIRLFGGNIYRKLSVWYHEKFDDITLASQVLEDDTKSEENKDDEEIAKLFELTETESFLQDLEQEESDKAVDGNVQGNITDIESDKVITVGGRTNSFMWPLNGTVSSPYGYRVHPFTSEYSMHNGLDIAANKGEPIVAAYNGTVIKSGYSKSYGYYIIISHGQNTQTLYAHCSKLLVDEGDVLSMGDKIALVGSTGVSTGPHLHFEVRVGSYRVNPEWFLSDVIGV